MLELTNRLDEYLVYSYKEEGVEKGTLNLRECDDWTEIVCLKVYEERKGMGTRLIKEMLEQLPYTMYFGSSRFKYVPFWISVGAEFEDEVTEEEIELDQDDDESVAEFIDFTLEVSDMDT